MTTSNGILEKNSLSTAVSWVGRPSTRGGVSTPTASMEETTIDPSPPSIARVIEMILNGKLTSAIFNLEGGRNYEMKRPTLQC